jgi:hypothetical protein
MCDFKVNLIAWMDGEVPARESALVEQHLANCAECRQRASAYEAASRDLKAYFVMATRFGQPVRPISRTHRWLPYVAGVAAALAIAYIYLPRSNQQSPVPSTVAVAVAPTPVEVPAAKAQANGAPVHRLVPVAKRRPALQGNAYIPESAASVPAIRIAIPADAVFPPGAVPDGFAYIASLAADGSIQQLGLQP